MGTDSTVSKAYEAEQHIPESCVAVSLIYAILYCKTMINYDSAYVLRQQIDSGHVSMKYKEGGSSLEHALNSMLKSSWQGSDCVGIWGWQGCRQLSPPFDDGGFRLCWLLLFADF